MSSCCLPTVPKSTQQIKKLSNVGSACGPTLRGLVLAE